MKGVSLNLISWELFEDEQRDKIKDICADSVRFCVESLFSDAEATVELDGESLFLNFHDEDFENYLGRVAFEDIFNAYTDSDKLPTQESKMRAIKMRDALYEVVQLIDKAVKDA